MSEFEDGVRNSFRSDAAPANEPFVQRISARIVEHERTRMIGLALAAAAAIALIAVMAVGVGMAAADLVSLAGRNLPALAGRPLLALVFAVPVAGFLLLAALAYPLVRPRK